MKITYIAIHHTAVSYGLNPDQFRATNNYHKKEFNMKSKLGYYVGYHYEISKTGVVRQARLETEPGAHVAGYNHLALGIALDGNFDIELPTAAQTEALRKLLGELKGRYPAAEIKYHRSFPKVTKSCPGKLIAADWAVNLLKNKDMLSIIGHSPSGRQFALGNDEKLHWIKNVETLNSFHNSGVINKNNVIWVDSLAAYEMGDVWNIEAYQ